MRVFLFKLMIITLILLFNLVKCELKFVLNIFRHGARYSKSDPDDNLKL